MIYCIVFDFEFNDPKQNVRAKLIRQNDRRGIRIQGRAFGIKHKSITVMITTNTTNTLLLGAIRYGYDHIYGFVV